MFDTHYEFRYINYRKAKPTDYFIKEHKLIFSSKSNQKYIVNVEEYKLHTYVIKFHLKSHSDSDNKYKLLTNQYDAVKILSTCVNIMLYFYKKDNLASFGFIGANLLDEDEANTKRFQVYKRIMENLFSPLYFHHYNIPEKSIYLLLNKANLELNTNLLDDIEQMFKNYYTFK